MRVHVEDPSVNEFLCRSNPYGSQPQISLHDFRQFLVKNPWDREIYVDFHEMKSIKVKFCRTCYRLAENYR